MKDLEGGGFYHTEIYDVLNKMRQKKGLIKKFDYDCSNSNSLELSCEEAKILKYILKLSLRRLNKLKKDKNTKNGETEELQFVNGEILDCAKLKTYLEKINERFKLLKDNTNLRNYIDTYAKTYDNNFKKYFKKAVKDSTSLIALSLYLLLKQITDKVEDSALKNLAKQDVDSPQMLFFDIEKHKINLNNIIILIQHYINSIIEKLENLKSIDVKNVCVNKDKNKKPIKCSEYNFRKNDIIFTSDKNIIKKIFADFDKFEEFEEKQNNI